MNNNYAGIWPKYHVTSYGQTLEMSEIRSVAVAAFKDANKSSRKVYLVHKAGGKQIQLDPKGNQDFYADSDLYRNAA